MTHIYADYWVNYRLIFASNTRIIGATITYNYKNNHKVVWGQNKYAPYFKTVTSDPYSAYIIPVTSDENLKHIIMQKLKGVKYRTFVVDGYLVYQPVRTVKKSV